MGGYRKATPPTAIQSINEERAFWSWGKVLERSFSREHVQQCIAPPKSLHFGHRRVSALMEADWRRTSARGEIHARQFKEADRLPHRTLARTFVDSVESEASRTGILSGIMDT